MVAMPSRAFFVFLPLPEAWAEQVDQQVAMPSRAFFVFLPYWLNWLSDMGLVAMPSRAFFVFLPSTI